MDSEARVGGKRRGFRRWKWVIVLLVTSPIWVFLLSNVFLASPWTCRWIAAKIQHATGMETTVGGASWSPWNGVAVDRIELLQVLPLRAALKEPLLKISTVRLTPVWRAWLHGQLEVQSIELDTPRVVLPLELVSYLARSAPPPTPPPAVAAGTPLPPAVVPTIPPAVPPVVGKPAPPAGPQPPTGWLRLKNASFAVVLAGSQQTLLEISHTTGSIPLSGGAARAPLKIGLVSAGGHQAAANLTASLDWTPPLLAMEPMEITMGACHLSLSGKIARFSGIPLQIEAHLPSQVLTEFAIPLGGRAGAESIAANAVFRGLLLAPGTWQGDLVAEAAAPSIQTASQEMKFDRGSSVTVLRHGVVSCVDARLTGDALSLLGNATLLTDGRAAGAIRLVSAPETVTAIASKIFPTIASAPSLTPLSTPQRAAFDVDVFGKIGQFYLRLGKEGPIVNLKP